MKNRHVNKVILVGDPKKSKLRKEFFGERFVKDHLSSLGVDLSVATTQLDLATVELQIWDISNNPIFDYIRNRFYLGADQIILVIDVTNHKALDQLEKWIMDLNETLGLMEKHVIVLGVRNGKNVFSDEQVKNHLSNIVKRNGLLYENFQFFNTALSTGENITQCLLGISERVYSKSIN